MLTHVYKGAIGKSYMLEFLMRDKQSLICAISYNEECSLCIRGIIHVNSLFYSVKDLMTAIPIWMKEKEICIIYTNKSEEENQELIHSLADLESEYGRQVAIVMCSNT